MALFKKFSYAMLAFAEFFHDFVANGHSHMRMVRRFEQYTIVNAGTLVPIHHPCFAELDTESKLVTFFDFKDGGLAEAAPIPPLTFFFFYTIVFI